MEVDNNNSTSVQAERILARFKSENGEDLGGLFDLPVSATVEHLNNICNKLLLKDEEPSRFTFFVNDVEVLAGLDAVIPKSREDVVEIVYQQEAIFKVRAITRCTSSMPGHAEAVVSVKFSPDGSQLASGSGDTTVRLWDLNTQTPLFTCSGHTNWVLCLAWSPDSTRLVSGGKNGEIIHWNASTGKAIGKPLKGHKQWITALVWKPFHLDGACRYFASSGKDGDIRIWDSSLGQCTKILTSHRQSISSLMWGATDLIYSASQDRTIKVWRASDGVLCRTLEGHAHWVNTLAVSTQYVMSHTTDPGRPDHKLTMQEVGERVTSLIQREGGERLVSGSDDFTLFLWLPESSNKPVARMTGHQQLINCVAFSPNTKLFASASFDKSIRLWASKDGKFIATLRGHVQAVYMVAWSADSRLLVSGSADSTLKLWNVKTKKMEGDLPGHQDQVFCVDWSSDGEKVASGGKDKMLRLWQH